MSIDTNPGPTTAALLPPDELRAGDILLMMGQGPLSDLIAWASDGPYSHAAIVADGGDLIEAAASGVRRYPLAQRVVDVVNYHFIDVFRVHATGAGALDRDELAAVLAKAQSLLGVRYPVDQLALLGVVMAVRGKWPVHPWARLLVRAALDHALPDNTGRMVCSEVVYRAYAQCAITPVGRLAPEIVVGERGTAPFPEIDWKALFDEIWPLLKPAGEAALQAPRQQLNALKSVDLRNLEANAVAPVSDAELEQMRQAVLADHSLRMTTASATGDALSGTGDAMDRAPNPRLVSPQDLAISPSVTRLGRLVQRPGG